MSGCNSCGTGCNPCQRGCKPARYSEGFSSSCDCPEETDTKLSIDVGGAALNYSAESHIDVITGSMLGSIITLPDLRDTDIDYDSFDSMCAELIYHKYGECGDGCRSAKDSWTTFALDDDGAKQNAIRHVRGVNAYGCPVFLDIPETPSEYWYAGWRTDGEGNKQFGYYQAIPVTELPKDSEGNSIVVSQDSNTKQPVVGPLKIQEFLDQHICTQFVPAPGFMIAGGANSFCYFPKQGIANVVLDLLCTTARPAQVCSDVWVATLQKPEFFPNVAEGGFVDLPLHCVYQNNTDGKIMPIWLRIDYQGRLLVTGEMTARPTSGKAAYMVIGVDDSIAWNCNATI